MKPLKKALRTVLIISFMASLFLGCGSDPADVVKEGHLKFDKSVTIGKALEKNQYLRNQTWNSFEDGMDRTIVEFTADTDIDGTGGSDAERKVIKEYGLHIQLMFQFIVNDDTFELSYAGFKAVGSDELMKMLDDDTKKAFFEMPSQGSNSVGYYFQNIWQNKRAAPFGMVATQIIEKIKDAKRDQKREAHRRQGMERLKPLVVRAFDIYGDVLKSYAKKTQWIKVEIMKRDENTHLVKIYARDGWLKGYIHIVSADTRSVCELTSVFNRSDSNSRHYAINDHPKVVLTGSWKGYKVVNNGDDLCGMGGSVEGTYSLEAMILFNVKPDGYIYPWNVTFPDDSVGSLDEKYGKYWWTK